MSDNTPYVVKQILRLYDIETIAFANKKSDYISMTVHVIFTPKKVSAISPKSVKCYGVVNYYKKGKRLEEMMLATELEMPILDYVDDKVSFYNFVEELIRDGADKEYDALDEIIKKHLQTIVKENEEVGGNYMFFSNIEQIKSWRWQCLDGGYNFAQKRHLAPNTGTTVSYPTSIMIFHGNPKPDKVVDPVITQHWK